MKKKKVLIVILIVAVLTAGIMLLLLRPVDTEEQAISIAQFYVKTIFGNEFDDYKIITELEGDIWNVYYYAEPTDGFTDVGGGGPELHILKAVGIPVYFALQA